MTIIEHPTLGVIRCVRSWRARRIGIAVREDGTIRITYPLFTSRSSAIAYAELNAEWIEQTKQLIEVRKARRKCVDIGNILLLRETARDTLPAMVERLAKEHGFEYNALRITSARTRWGSCSGKNNISLSFYVAALPQHLQEFIILHELCHTRQHNHSAAFHKLLDSCVEGREKLLNKELRSYRIPTEE